MRTARRVFDIPASAPFLTGLAEALLGNRLVAGTHDPRDPTVLARATIYLPTQRAARALAAVLADRAGGGAILLPRIVPLGEADEIETRLSIHESAAIDLVSLPPPIDETRRQLTLARLILAWSGRVNREVLALDPDGAPLVPRSPGEALVLAGHLARLMDAVETEGGDWAKLTEARYERHDRIWEITRDFLTIAAQAWPVVLAEAGLANPAARRDALLRAEAARLTRDGHPHPIIVAGSTGTVPATAALIAAVAGLPRGAVVLPGLDRTSDEATWAAIGHDSGHPQHNLHRLIETIGVERAEVAALAEPRRPARDALIREAMRPGETIAAWAESAPETDSGSTAAVLDGVTLIEAPDERLEALAIAVALREALEEPGATAALVTPDRALAERVAIELRRWRLEVDDSAGQSLARMPLGRLAGLTADAAANEMAPLTLAALLAHPDVTLGLTRETVEAGAAALELALWRTGRRIDALAAPEEAGEAMRKACADPHALRPLRDLGEDDIAAGVAVAERLAAALGALRDGPADVASRARATRLTIEALTRREDGEARLASREDGRALIELLDEIAAAPAAADLPCATALEWRGVLRALVEARVVRRPGSGGRIKIWGLLEARLLEADLVVMGGLADGIWPPQVMTDPFVNRAMRAALGLSPPERRIGQTAHDFVQGAGAPRVVMSYASKTASGATIASRFVQRLAALAGAEAMKGPRARGKRLIALAAGLDAPGRITPVARPAPKPPAALQPVKLSVTQIETLIRDPYAVHARKILGLDPLPELDAPPGAADRGQIVHKAIERFVKDHPDRLPADPLAEFIAIGRETFDAYTDEPDVQAFWWPRFVRSAAFYVGWEAGRRADLARLAVEAGGAIEIGLADGTRFRLTAKADRIETGLDGRLRIIDFKTGTPPTNPQVSSGLAPQLPLEALMAAEGGFRGVPAAGTEELLYVRLMDPSSGGKASRVGTKDTSPDELASAIGARLRTLLSAYRSGRIGFRSRVVPFKERDRGDYDHLARVLEWSTAGEDGGDDGAEA